MKRGGADTAAAKVLLCCGEPWPQDLCLEKSQGRSRERLHC